MTAQNKSVFCGCMEVDLASDVAVLAGATQRDRPLARSPRSSWRGSIRVVARSLTRRWLMLCWVSLVAVASWGAAEGADDIDLKTSRVYMRVGKTGFGHEHAVVGRLKSGRLRLGAEENAGELVFDMPTFDADSTAARRYVGLKGETDSGTRQEVNTNMLGPAVLDVKKYPTATFAIQSAEITTERSRDGHPVVKLTGDFTLHGAKRSLDVFAELIDEQGTKRVRGGFPLKQTDYGIKPFSKAFGAIGVADEMTVYGEIVLAATTDQRARRAPANPNTTR